MAKALKTAAIVVGVAALAVTGAGIIGGAAFAASSIGVGSLTVAGLGTVLGAAATAASFGAGLLAKKPVGTLGGNATKFTIDKDTGIPIAMGRTYSGGRVVHRQYHGPSNSYESWVTVHSLGPVKSLQPLQIDQNAVTFSGGAAPGAYAGSMWLADQLGACPEPAALAGPFGAFPGWDATSKLSGLAADLWTLKYDSKGKVYPTGVPQRGRVIEGVYVYDPRLDSTYPGGSGACRIADASTWVWSESPALHAITFAYGRYQNGHLIAGGGMVVDGIDMAPFVEWANVCDANGWKAGGIVYTTSDASWDVLKMIAQAGGAEVFPSGGRLSCSFNAPRVSIGTIVSADIAGDLDVPAAASIRDRRNTIIPRVRLESQGWEVVPISPVTVPDYVTLDGGTRPKEIEYPLVQDADQGAQLALYDLLNMREIDGISVPVKIYAIGYLPGDCLTLDIPEADLLARGVIVRERELDAAGQTVTFTCRTETAAKHPFALAGTGVPPRTPDLSVPPLGSLAAPGASAWSLGGATLTSDGGSIPALLITGAADNPNAEAIIFEYRPSGGSDWSAASLEVPTTVRKEITSVTPGTAYQVAVSYRVRGVIGTRLILGPATAGTLAVAGVATETALTAATDALAALTTRINGYSGSGPIP